jgi:hypothetical protein
VPPKRKRPASSGGDGRSSNLGHTGRIISVVGNQDRLWARFMKDDLSSFRATSGHTALASFAASVFKDRSLSFCNLIVAGNAPLTSTGRSFELKAESGRV